MFHVGQKVVCVDDSSKDGVACALRKRSVYTISFYAGDSEGGYCLTAECSPPDPWPFFDARRFRPLEEKPDAIERVRQIAFGPEIPGGDHLDKRVREPQFVGGPK